MKNNKLYENSNRILSYFRECKVGEELCLLQIMRENGLADAYYYDAVKVLLFNGFIEEMHNGGFFKLGQKGFNYLQGGEPLMLSAPPFSQLLYWENIKSKDSDFIFNELWNLIGTEDEAQFYIDGPTYYNVIKGYIRGLYPTYSDFMEHLRSSKKSTSRIKWYRELFKEIEGEDIRLFLDQLSDAVNQKIESETGDESSFFNNTLQQTSKDSLNSSIIKDSSNKGVTVFISYAWGEKQEQVHQIATKLQEAGIEVRIDQKVPYGADLINFMNTEIQECDICLIFLTPTYKEKAETSKGGVGVEYEGRVISREIYKNQNTNKFIPVLLSGDFNCSTPNFLFGRKGFNFVDYSFDSQINLMIKELKNRNNY